MKRYLAFAGSIYYPGGGWEDFAGNFDTVEAAKAATTPQPDYEGQLYPWLYKWAHVVDITTGRIVARHESEHDDSDPTEWVDYGP